MPSGLRTSPTGRIPQWVVDEAGGRPPAAAPWRSWTPDPPSTGPGRSRRRRRTIALAVLVGVLLLSAVLLDPRGLGGARRGWPTPGYGAADAPLGTPLEVPERGGEHVFVAVQEDGLRPVAYDPCRPIHYVIRPDNAPVGGEALVHDAFARISSVTGLRFRYDGATDEVFSGERANYQPERYGDRWAPVLVSWQTEAESPELAGDVAGRAGSAMVQPPGGPRVLVTGLVELDAAAFDRMLADPERVARARAIVLHELGHLVGLTHVADPGQLMHPRTGTALDFAPGDLSGLSQLGAGECVPDV